MGRKGACLTVFLATLNQMGILFSMILVGYIAAKCRVVPENAAGILSKLENTVFVPALVLGTFLNHFTLERIG